MRPWAFRRRFKPNVRGSNAADAHRVIRSVEHYLTHKLKLAVNQQKSRVCKTASLDFPGFAFEGYGGQIRVSPKNEQKFKDRIRELTRRNRGVSMTYR